MQETIDLKDMCITICFSMLIIFKLCPFVGKPFSQVKALKAHHRRKSSERVVTMEGPRKVIRDFNVNEMNKKFEVGGLSKGQVGLSMLNSATKGQKQRNTAPPVAQNIP